MPGLMTIYGLLAGFRCTAAHGGWLPAAKAGEELLGQYQFALTGQPQAVFVAFMLDNHFTRTS